MSIRGTEPSWSSSVREWALHLRRHDPLRAAAEHVLAGGSVDREAVGEALSRLGPRRGKIRRWQVGALAAWILGRGALSSAEREQAVTVLREAAGARAFVGPRRAVLRGAGLAAATAVALATFGLVEAAAASIAPTAGGGLGGILAALSLLASILVALGGVPVGIVASLAWDRDQARMLRAHSLFTLGVLQDVQSVGPLAEAACDRRSVPVRAAGQAGLAKVLPCVGGEHYGVLAPGAVPALCRALLAYGGVSRRWPPDEALAHAALGALDRAGDGRAVDTVQRVARRGLPSLQQAAGRVLPILLERRQREHDTGHLLRPADAPDRASLLRPAASAPAAPVEQLLRPADPALTAAEAVVAPPPVPVREPAVQQARQAGSHGTASPGE